MIQKFQNPSGRLKINLSPEQLARWLKEAIAVPGTNINSNVTVNQSKKTAQQAQQNSRRESLRRMDEARNARRAQRAKMTERQKTDEYTQRLIAEANKPTWRSTVADGLHMLGEAAMASTPITAVSYFGAKGLNNVWQGAVSRNTDQALGGVADLGFAVLPWMKPFRAASTTTTMNQLNEVKDIEKRAFETAMRTTPHFNPIPEIKKGITLMLEGNNGGKGRLLHIGDYILTGTKHGPKGYYNSFARFLPLNTSLFTIKPTLKTKWLDFKNPKGMSYAYSGFVNNSGYTPIMLEKNDMIDAFLYNKTIDPSFGLLKVSQGRGFGAHTDYVKENYANKASDIPVYEFNKTSVTVPEESVLITSGWHDGGIPNGFTSNYNDYLNVGGHWERLGRAPDGTSVVQGEDIWKFLPSDYKARWLDKYGSFQEKPWWYKKIAYLGVKRLDKLGTPVITRTKWEPL